MLSHLLLEKIKIYNFQLGSCDLIKSFENEVAILKARQSEDFLRYLQKICPGIDQILNTWRENIEYYNQGDMEKFINLPMFWGYKFDIFFNMLRKFISHKYNKQLQQIIECEFSNCGFKIYHDVEIVSEEVFQNFLKQFSIDLAYIFRVEQSRIKIIRNARFVGFGGLYSYEWIYVELLDKM